MRAIFLLFLLSLQAFADTSLEQYAAIVGVINPSTRRIPTLNRNGEAMCFTTELTDVFLEDCQNYREVLEVGCAYGIKSSQIVQRGAFLTANDLAFSHLDVMKEAFAQLAAVNPAFDHVRYLPGNFALMNEAEIGTCQYDAILCESVLHFMNPDEFQNALKSFNNALIDQGKLYVTILSPYHPQFYDVFQRNQASGVKWPGVFTYQAETGPITYNIIDEERLVEELRLAGFQVLMSKYISKPFQEKESQFDGRDWIIAIAQKKRQYRSTSP